MARKKKINITLKPEEVKLFCEALLDSESYLTDAARSAENLSKEIALRYLNKAIIVRNVRIQLSDIIMKE